MSLSSNKRRKRLIMWTKNPTCYVCKKKIKHFHDSTLEHILPKFHGGKNTQRNLSISHRQCNFKRGNIYCPVILNHKYSIHSKLIIQFIETSNAIDPFKESVRVWRIRLKHEYLNWINANINHIGE